MKTLFILLTAIIVLSTTSCIKHEQKPCPTDFRVFGEITPYDSIYKIGDTLTLSSDYHYMVYETNTETNYNLKDIIIEASLSVINIDTICDNLDIRLLDFVDIVPSDVYYYYIQNFSSGHSTLYSNIILDVDTFRNEVKIVLKKSGLYMLGYGPYTIENRSSFKGKCDLYEFDLFSRLNKGLDNNINLLALSPDDHFNNWILKQHPEQNFYHSGGFAYKVE